MRVLVPILVSISLYLFLLPKTIFANISFLIDSVSVSSEISFSASISGLTSSSCLDNHCYLQAVLSAISPVRYFGQTKNSQGQWIDYSSSPTIDYIKSQFLSFSPSVEGSWSGQVFLRFDPSENNYKGPGQYVLKLKRFTGKSSNAAGESNEIQIDLSAPTPVTNTPSPTPIVTEASSSSLAPPTQSTTTPASSQPAMHSSSVKPSPAALVITEEMIASSSGIDEKLVVETAPSLSPVPVDEPKKAHSNSYPLLAIAFSSALVFVIRQIKRVK